MRSLYHITLGCLVALGTSQMPWLLSLVVITQSAIAKAQYDIYQSDVTNTTPHLSNIVLMLLAGFVVMVITRVML